MAVDLSVILILKLISCQECLNMHVDYIFFHNEFKTIVEHAIYVTLNE